MSFLRSFFLKAINAYRYYKIRTFIKGHGRTAPSIAWHPSSTKWLGLRSDMSDELRDLWKSSCVSIDEGDYALFWDVYVKLPIPYQVASLVRKTRVEPLQHTDYFYSDHMMMDHSGSGSTGVQPRLWLSEDMIEWDVPLEYVWNWVHSVMFNSSGELLDETAAYLLAGYPYEALLSQYYKHANTTGKNSPFFFMLLLALTFRMSFTSYAQDFVIEQHEWLDLFKTWPLEHRIKILKVLRISDKASVKEYCVAWAPILFPEAGLSLTLYDGSSKHPADVILAWYVALVDEVVPTHEVNDLLLAV